MGRLLQDVLRGLAAGKCSAAARDAALAAVESLLDHGSPLTERVLAPHALLLASSLREVIQLTSNAPSDSKKRLKVHLHLHSRIQPSWCLDPVVVDSSLGK